MLQMETNHVFTTPDGQRYDLGEVNAAEVRVNEIAYLTPTKAPELLSTFNKALFTLSRYYSAIMLGHQKAIKAVSNRAAVLMIDVIPAVIEEKKLSNNAEIRKALVDRDLEYSQLLDKELEFQASALFFRRKIEDFESALSSAKRVLHDTELTYGRVNPNVSQTGSINYAKPKDEPRPVVIAPNGLKIGKL